jgi:membrane protein insertase Oxa1/YidC/SpoIIIJ
MVCIQIPVLLALYWVFAYESFPILNTARLYTLTPIPHTISLQFLGLISVTGKSMILAVIAGLTQLLQAHMTLTGSMKLAPQEGMQGDFQKIIGLQLKYVFPFLIGTISYTTSGAVALYFISTNLAGSLQEWYMRRALVVEATSPQSE